MLNEKRNTVRNPDLRLEENYNEFLRLLQDDDYLDVTHDEASGGVSAIHKGHRLDKSLGPNREKRGSYELRTVEALRRDGHSIILLKESGEVGVKQYDGLLDGIPCEIKAVEMMGRWTIRTKIANAIRQGAKCVVLYFQDASLFSVQQVQVGWKDCLSYAKPDDLVPEIKLLCVVSGTIHNIEKPSW